VIRVFAGVAIVAVLLAAQATTSAQTVDPPRLDKVETFAFALGSENQGTERLSRLARYDLVVLDGVDSDQSLIDGLKARGVIVLGYLSVGTIERGRPWSRAAKPYRLERWEDFDEWYADVSEPGFRTLIAGEVGPGVLDRGFDGLFLDNTDMVTSHPDDGSGMDELVHALAGVVHSRSRLLFTQNGEDVIGPTLDLYDGWNREDVSSTYAFDDHGYVRQSAQAVRAAQQALRRIHDAGIFVTATDYLATGDRVGTKRAIRNACAADAIPFVSNIELNRIPADPPRCPPR
jgi:hypothetical protein